MISSGTLNCPSSLLRGTFHQRLVMIAFSSRSSDSNGISIPILFNKML
jgi:hypothetical protein